MEFFKKRLERQFNKIEDLERREQELKRQIEIKTRKSRALLAQLEDAD